MPVIHAHWSWTIQFTDNYSCIRLDLHLKRMNGYYFIHMYVPSILIVMLSWISFWLDIDATPARVSLGILTVLAMTTQNKYTGEQRVSYVTAMNVWTAASLAFVFLAVIEFAYINVQTRQRNRKVMARVSSTISLNSTHHKLNSDIYSTVVSDTNPQQVRMFSFNISKYEITYSDNSLWRIKC